MPEFEPGELLAVLERHGVRYVIIGGFAAILYGATHVTTDLDITPQDGRDNLDRLAAALREVHARIRVTGEPDGIRFDISAESLARAGIWNLVTDHGDLDITFVPSGTRGYDDLARDRRTMSVLGIDAPVASLADVIRSKEAAGRPKDQPVLPVLRRILDETTLPRRGR